MPSIRLNIQLGLIASMMLQAIPTQANTHSSEISDPEIIAAAKHSFYSAKQQEWTPSFHDSATGDWSKLWFLDGEVASVENHAGGMQLTAGPQFLNDAHHMVLWTKQSFSGDLKIEFEFTRLDFETRCVVLLLIQATGSGKEPFHRDISTWNDLRTVPAMRLYFENMHTYHLAFAAFPNTREENQSYIRARRYLPNSGKGLRGTELRPDFFPENLFEPGVPHQVTVIKKDRSLHMKVENAGQTFYAHFVNDSLPIVEEGRFGIRQMFTRSSLFKNIRISEIAADD